MEEELGTFGANLATSPGARLVTQLLRDWRSASSIAREVQIFNAHHFIWQTQPWPKAKVVFKDLEEQL